MASTPALTRQDMCAVTSRASGEDPIGSAWSTQRYTMIEIGLPWVYDMFESPKVPPGLTTIMADLYSQGIYPPTIGFAPDEAWSVPGMTRVITLESPEPSIQEYQRREFLIPTDRVAEVYPALIESPQAPDLEPYALPESSTRDLFVCTHAAIDACCATMGYPIYKLLRHMVESLPTPTRAWRCTHFGGHRFAGTLLDMPSGRYWGHLDARDLAPLLKRTGDVDQMRQHYRGWAALPYGAAQVAEGELFLRVGWRWLECSVTPGQTPPFDWEHPALVEQSVRFEVAHEGLGVAGAVEVLISPTHVVQTRETSKSSEWHDAQQYATKIVSSERLDELLG